MATKMPTYTIASPGTKPDKKGTVGTYSTTSALASIELPNGLTYIFFYDYDSTQSLNYLSYLYGPSDESTYSPYRIQVDGAYITNDHTYALTAAQEGDNIHLFYINDSYYITELVFNIPTRTWKNGSIRFQTKTGTGIGASGNPVLKVNYIPYQSSKVAEAYFTLGTWTSVVL